MATILVVEDEDVLYYAIERTLEKLGHKVHWANRIEAGKRLFNDLHPDLTLLDLRLPDGSGLDLLAQLRSQSPPPNIILMTAYASVEDAVAAIKLGASDYLQKPLHMDDLRYAVSRTLEEAQLKREVSYFRSREARGAGIEGIVGNCPAIVELRSKVARLTSLPADTAPPTVLITGETGTGKGLLARVMHYNGPRAAAPFIEINCAAIPDNLVEAELFGYERGAFTDAKAARVGLIQSADGGTLFLDEVGCLPAATQVKLLKAIEEKTVRPIGSQVDRMVDVHTIAATNSDLEEMVRTNRFRDDLYYRLRVAVLHSPALRDRGDDLLLLAQRFVTEICERYRLPPKHLTATAQKEIAHYSWPGNIRELRNTLDRALLFSEGPEIDAAALGLPTRTAGWMRWRVEGDGRLDVELPDTGIQFDELERALISAALRKTGGRQIDAAKLLGMSRDTLRYRIEKFGIDPSNPDGR
ncbi:MAG: sigma-54-dependent Fis family transcriptional regulator [Deltaproteobacteria bacterium]|nr:sigma-54-dependent Fis family transcriptional regulator [Deltaproteobacteria bacterium]